jgi:hypothetical protein
MTKQELKQLIKECLNEVRQPLSAMFLPPGFNSNDFKSLEDFSQEPEELDEAEEAEEPLFGAPTTDLSSDEMAAYLQRIAGKTTEKGDKFKYPYIHRSNIIDDSGNIIPQDKLKSLIKVRPDKLLKQNTKMQKSGGANFIFYDISLPALRGLIVDESTNEFKIVNTCPGAGACKTYCYAKKGGYVQWKASSLFQTRMVNFLLNDYVGFKAKLLTELNNAVRIKSKKGVKVVLRWHDSGDFMSEKYLQMAYDIAKATPDIIHYAYTKRVGMVSASAKPKNFVFNFSKGASAPEEGQIQVGSKQSIVVPKQTFQDLMHKDNEKKKWVFNTPQDEETFKRKMSLKYNIDEDSILTYDEMVKLPYDQNIDIEPKWNIIVVPGDGDVSAMRKDVLGTYLLIH